MIGSVQPCRTLGTALALAVLMALATAPFAAADSAAFRRVFVSIGERVSPAVAGESLEAYQWEEREARARAPRVDGATSIGILDRPGIGLLHRWEAGFTGVGWAGRARMSEEGGGEGSGELGVFLRNAERNRLLRMGGLASQARLRAELRRKGILLEELKTVLLLRTSLHGAEHEEAERRKFDSFLDTLLLRLRPYVEGRMIPPNSLANILALKEANRGQIRYLEGASELLVKSAGEDLVLDTVDFMSLDMDGILAPIEASRLAGSGPKRSYGERLDSLEYAMAVGQIELERVREERLFLGLGVEGAREPAGPMEKGYAIKLSWTATLGGPGRSSLPPPPPLLRRPAKTSGPADPATLEGGSDPGLRRLLDGIESRLGEIRLGQAVSVYSLSESLSRLLEHNLLPIPLLQARRRRTIQSVDALEEFGLIETGPNSYPRQR